MARPPAQDLRSPERRVSPALEPPHLHPAYRSTVLRAPSRPPLRIPYGPGELARLNAATLLDASAHRRAGRRPHPPARAASRSASASSSRARSSTARAARSRARWSRSGRPTPPAATRTPSISIPAPLDPNFTGAGACITNEQGRYHFLTIKPGAYPWGNHANAWRPAHIHFSVIGNAFVERVVTQMYFPGDPLLEHDPIYNALHDERARASLVGQLDLSATVPAFALAYHFDIVVGGRAYG